MAKPIKNENSILFLYEGETEAEFYLKIFDQHIAQREIRINKANLNGVYNLDHKVKAKVNSYLYNNKFSDCKSIHVFVAYDREGARTVEPQLNVELLKREFVKSKSRIKSINEVVATQDLESWFYHDMPGIYKYLKVPVAERKHDVYPNVDATHNRLLSALFHRYNKHYQKGKRAEGFIDALDIPKIVSRVPELQEMIGLMNGLV